MARRFFREPLDSVLIVKDQSRDQWYPVELHCGLKLALRPSNCLAVPDISILHEILADDQYRLARLVRHGDTVVDIGAHIGIYSILAAAQCRDGEVLAFEPEPSNYRMLRLNAALNPMLPIHTFNQAIAGFRSERRLHLSRTNSGGHTLLPASGDSISVTCITLGQVLQLTRNSSIGMLKMDCEGAEFEIIATASLDNLRRIDRIIMEVHDAAYTRPGDIDSLFNKLWTASFSIEILRSIAYRDEGHFQIVFASRNVH